MIAGEENPISSRLQIKQYLWAIVIKGKFNSLPMPHYAWLGKVHWGCAAPSVGAEVTRNFSPRSAPCMVPGSRRGSRREGHTEARSGSYRSDLQVLRLLTHFQEDPSVDPQTPSIPAGLGVAGSSGSPESVGAA